MLPMTAGISRAVQAIRAVPPNPEAEVDVLPTIGPAPAMIVDAAASADCGLLVTGVARFNHVGDFLSGAGSVVIMGLSCLEQSLLYHAALDDFAVDANMEQHVTRELEARLDRFRGAVSCAKFL
jgi:hypothetical protein